MFILIYLTMKYENPILIIINNTLHIKADNLEPVEVDSSCVKQLEELVYPTAAFRGALPTGINIQELSDRIEVRTIEVGDKVRQFTIQRAFLLPEKEDLSWNDMSKEEVNEEALPSLSAKYSIEEIETAVKEEINKYFGITMRESVTKAIISNLKK